MFEHKTRAQWCIYLILKAVYKFRHDSNRAVEISGIQKHRFPLCHCCGTGDLASVVSAYQTNNSWTGQGHYCRVDGSEVPSETAATPVTDMRCVGLHCHLLCTTSCPFVQAITLRPWQFAVNFDGGNMWVHKNWITPQISSLNQISVVAIAHLIIVWIGSDQLTYWLYRHVLHVTLTTSASSYRKIKYFINKEATG